MKKAKRPAAVLLAVWMSLGMFPYSIAAQDQVGEIVTELEEITPDDSSVVGGTSGGQDTTDPGKLFEEGELSADMGSEAAGGLADAIQPTDQSRQADQNQQADQSQSVDQNPPAEPGQSPDTGQPAGQDSGTDAGGSGAQNLSAGVQDDDTGGQPADSGQANGVVEPMDAGQALDAVSSDDAGQSPDGASSVDAGQSPGGASSADAGQSPDGASSADAGQSPGGASSVDAGQSPDGASSVDADQSLDVALSEDAGQPEEAALPADEPLFTEEDQPVEEDVAADGDVSAQPDLLPDEEETESDKETQLLEDSMEKKGEGGFVQSITVDDVIITVEAAEGVFPADAVLSVDKAESEQQQMADEVISALRDDNTNVAVSYTFDIKILAPDGTKLQPQDGEKVAVSFALAQVGNENLDMQVYHLPDHPEEEEDSELNAEKLDQEIDELNQCVTVETGGFSLYTVEFTYEAKEYVLQDGETVAVSRILGDVGLTGNVESVQVSDETLLSATNENGEWFVHSHEAFTSPEWMKVTIDGVDYEIGATDDQAVENGAADDRTKVSGQDNAPRSGEYHIFVQALGKGFAEYYDLIIEVSDADGNVIGTFDHAAYGTDEWAKKKIPATFSVSPAKISFSIFYKGSGEETYNQIMYETDFEESCVDRVASGSYYNEMNEPVQVDFCRYSIECVEADNGPLPPLQYVDANNYHQVQNDYVIFKGNFGNKDTVEDTTWYALRDSFAGSTKIRSSIMVFGHVNLVLCDDKVLECEGITLALPGSSLTIWKQAGGSGQLICKAPETTLNGKGAPGITVEEGTSLTINGGKITATGSIRCAGIGGSYKSTGGDITINAGTVRATGGDLDGESKESGAGIGASAYGSSGDITINGGVVITKARGVGGAGIGGGYNGGCGAITINGGSVTADAHKGAAIGTGGFENGTTESSSDGIDGTKSGTITITGGMVKAITEGFGAAIGGGMYIQNPRIVIKGGKIIACGGDPGKKDGHGLGAGIGGGYSKPQGGDIIITGGDITAMSVKGAAIGGGAHDENGYDAGTIRISGDSTTVVAMSQEGAGIGGGGCKYDYLLFKGGSGGNITIDGGSVFAMSTRSGAGIGGGNQGPGGNITINGGYVVGVGGSYTYNWFKGKSPKYDKMIESAILKEKFSSDIFEDILLALIFNDKYSGAGIGGGDRGNGGTVSVNGGIVIATGGTNDCSAIGGGHKEKGNVSLSIYPDAHVTYGNYNSAGDDIAMAGVADENNKTDKAKNNTYVRIEPEHSESGYRLEQAD